MEPWRDITFRVPNIAALTDAQLRALLPNRDGRWSEAIAWGMAALKASKLDLNSQWADTSQDWTCPCCQRRKIEILRVSSQGVLLATLHDHHDHLQDVIGRTLQSQLPHPWVKHIPEGTYELEHLGSRMLARFQPTIVCADCSGAEGSAKNRLRHIHRDFSFRPSEIATFITVAAHRGHQVDLETADAIWKAQESDFLERLALAEQLTSVILAGRMTQERSIYRPPISEAQAHMQYWMRLDPRPSGVSDDLEVLRQRSVAREGVGAQVDAGSKGRRSTTPPTDAEVEAHDGGAEPKLWEKLDAGWRCPGCDRDRKGLVRRSKKPGRRWSGGVRTQGIRPAGRRHPGRGSAGGHGAPTRAPPDLRGLQQHRPAAASARSHRLRHVLCCSSTTSARRSPPRRTNRMSSIGICCANGSDWAPRGFLPSGTTSATSARPSASGAAANTS
ncbi:hypothetical protein [Caulobacter segnis]|uniref:hypothetical protein n=1 Tax=Caulobacter segnis TaxID=88688 RepID=UPI0026EF0E69|nr:hypothetical protein [Caulobacter segnis]